MITKDQTQVCVQLKAEVG